MLARMPLQMCGERARESTDQSPREAPTEQVIMEAGVGDEVANATYAASEAEYDPERILDMLNDTDKSWLYTRLQLYLSHLGRNGSGVFDNSTSHAASSASSSVHNQTFAANVTVETAMFEFIVDGIVLTSISIFGFIGTILSIPVLFSHLAVKNSFSILLIGLAICDASFLFMAVLTVGLPKSWQWYSQVVSVEVMPLGNGLISIARTGSVYMTMAVTLERYFATVRPLSRFSAKKYLMPAAMVFAICYNIPRFFELRKSVFEYTNETMVVGTELRHNKLYMSVYMFWLKVAFLEVLPYVVIIYFNCRIIIRLFKSAAFRRNFLRSQPSSPQGSGSAPGNGPAGPRLSPGAGYRRQQQSEVLDQQGRRLSSPRGTRERLLLREDQNGHQSISVHADEDEGQEHIHSQKHTEARAPQSKSASLVRSGSSARPALVRCKSTSAGGGNVSHAHQEDQELNLGITLVFISLLFIVCQAPKLIPDLYELTCDTTASNTCRTTVFIDRVISISNLMSCVNSAANFLVYMLKGRKFREAFCNTYGCRRRRRPSDVTARPGASTYSIRHHTPGAGGSFTLMDTDSVRGRTASSSFEMKPSISRKSSLNETLKPANGEDKQQHAIITIHEAADDEEKIEQEGQIC